MVRTLTYEQSMKRKSYDRQLDGDRVPVGLHILAWQVRTTIVGAIVMAVGYAVLVPFIGIDGCKWAFAIACAACLISTCIDIWRM